MFALQRHLAVPRGDDSVHDDLYQYTVTGPGDVYSDPGALGRRARAICRRPTRWGLMLHMTELRPVGVLALMDNLDTRVDVGRRP